ncbi:MAG: alanine--glyoxylate aminotransferase family protein [Halanaerobium sp.]|nr:alanine--glyoxylate aminotransferase family protein [Halanaerobium sp.]
MEKDYRDLNPRVRTLMGPGPSNVDPRVLRVMATPLVGHLDPDFLKVMNDTMELLRYVFGTDNQLTIPMSGTGSAGMETCLVNLLEPGDKIIVGVNGLFGQRMCDIGERCGAEVIQVAEEWGKIIQPGAIEDALKANPGVKAVAVVHAETSTGVCQPLQPVAEVAHRYGALLIVDTVTSLGGIPVELDENDVDAAFSGTQKCLSCPPGLSPVSLNERAVEVLQRRESKIRSWYLDLKMISSYWGEERFYHHTAPINMIYALREALRIIKEEGLENTFARHELHGRALARGLEAMGLELLVEEEYRLPELTAVFAPEGIEEVEVRKALLNEYSLEIGGGLGDLQGKIWRIGLMGTSCTRKNVTLFLSALENILAGFSIPVTRGTALAAVEEFYRGRER